MIAEKKCDQVAIFQRFSQFVYGHNTDIMWYWQNTKYYDVFFLATIVLKTC